MSAAKRELAFTPASELLSGFAAKRFSPVDVLDAVFWQLERLEPAINAFCHLDRASALLAAEASAARWQRGAPQGLLDGVPVSVKDIILTRGWPTLRGSRTINPDQDWSEDGPAVARLREHGAVLFGKTTTPEFAFKAVTDSPLTGITRNIWDLGKTPGGSSGGASTAVAAGIGPLALATDAGGSIRIPSSFAGVFGHKPSGGRVAMYPPTPYSTLAAFGPIARTVTDAALMLSVIATPDPRDWDAATQSPAPYHQLLEADPRQWRIAYSPTLGFVQVDPEVRRITEAAIKTFEALGAKIDIVETVIADPRSLLERFKRGLTDYAFRHIPDDAFARMDPALADEIKTSRSADLREHLQAQTERAELAARINAIYQNYDLLITPATPTAAFPVGQNRPDGYEGRSWYGFSFPFNLTRQPAASIPCGLTEAGLPVGLQIVGPRHDDLIVLQAAYAFECAHPRLTRPPLAVKD